MTKIFKFIYPAPLLVRLRSRECFTYLYRVMKLIGWKPPTNNVKRYFYLCWTILAFCSELYLPIGVYLNIAKNLKTFTPADFLGSLYVFLTQSGSKAKTWIMLYFFDNLNETESIFDTLDKQLKTDDDRQQIHKAVAQSNYVFLIYFFIYVGYAISGCVVGVIIRQPPWMMYNPFFDWRAGGASLWMHFCIEGCMITLGGLTLLIMDTYPLMFIIMARAHLNVLKDHIRILRKNPLKTEAESYEDLVDCIIYNKFILKSCAVLRPIVSRTIFVQFLLVGILLGVSMINVLYFLDLLNAISSIIYATGILMESFPFCYYCDLLVEDCRTIADLLGQSNWIDAEPKYKSTLKIFMHHAQQPITFIAGGIFHITMNTNFQMAKFAFSVMTIVQQMNLADKFDLLS